MKKSVLICFCVLLSVLVLLMQGCDKSDDGDGKVNGDNERVDDNRYGVVIDSCRQEKDVRADGQVVSMVIVKYLFTNHSGEEMAFAYPFRADVYQNGVSLMNVSVLDLVDNSFTKIQAGVTVEIERAYILNDLESDIEVKVENVTTDKVVRKIFAIE